MYLFISDKALKIKLYVSGFKNNGLPYKLSLPVSPLRGRVSKNPSLLGVYVMKGPYWPNFFNSLRSVMVNQSIRTCRFISVDYLPVTADSCDFLLYSFIVLLLCLRR